MKKKYYIYKFIDITIILQVVSCNTDRFPETSVSDGNFWNSASDVRIGAKIIFIQLYQGLRRLMITGLSDAS